MPNPQPPRLKRSSQESCCHPQETGPGLGALGTRSRVQPPSSPARRARDPLVQHLRQENVREPLLALFGPSGPLCSARPPPLRPPPGRARAASRSSVRPAFVSFPHPPPPQQPPKHLPQLPIARLASGLLTLNSHPRALSPAAAVDPPGAVRPWQAVPQAERAAARIAAFDTFLRMQLIAVLQEHKPGGAPPPSLADDIGDVLPVDTAVMARPNSRPPRPSVVV